MRQPAKKVASIFFVFLSGISTVFSQKAKTDLEYGVNLGFMVYQGDLSNVRIGSLRTQKLFVDLHAAKLLGDFFSASLHFSMGKLKGDDTKFDTPEYKKHRAFNFRTPIYELTARILWDPFGKNYRFKGFSPYLFVGAGVTFLHIKRDWSQLDRDYFALTSPVLAELAEDSAQKLPNLIPVFPIGGGLKYIISPKLTLNAELGYRFNTTSDYLDGFSKSGNPKRKDSYASYSVGFIFRPGKKDPFSCPVPKY